MHKNRGSEVLGATALSSLFAASAGAILFYLVIDRSHILLPLLSVKVQWTISMIILLVLLLNRSNRKFENFIFVAFGLSLSCIGYNPTGISITFDMSILNPGLNTSIVMIMLYVIPNLLKYYHNVQISRYNEIFTFYQQSMKWTLNRLQSTLRGTVVGCFSGLIPGVGPVICSNIAGSIENKINQHRKINELLAAESANNSAIIVALIPFMGLGLIMLPHEAIVYDLLMNQGVAINIQWLEQNNVLSKILVFAVLANIIAFLISWPASRYLITLYSLIDYKLLVKCLILFLGMFTLYQSYSDYRLDLDLLTIAIFIPATVFITLRKLDSLPLIFSYLIGDQVVKSSIFLYNIL
jgi:putative tricarboxylic transport membrane protein